MNIGIDARPALKNRTGVGNYVLNLILALSRLDEENQYHLFSSSYKDRFNLPRINGLPNWHVKDYKFPNVIMNYLWNNMGRLSFNVLLGGMDVFHFTGDISYPLKNIPTVATIYDLYHLRHPESVEKKFRLDPMLFKEKINAVSKIIAISSFTKKDLMGLFDVPEEKISVIPLGVDPGVFKPLAETECAAYLKKTFQLEGDYLLCVGAMETRKNYAGMMDAFRLILDKQPHLKLVLVGGGGWGYERVLGKILESNMEKSVRLLGYLATEDLNYLYNGARAFVFPSMYEGFGLPLLEAFACGTPSAVTNSTALPEVAGDAALLFDPAQPEDIADKVLQIIEDSGLARRLKEKGLNRIREFNWENTGRQTLQLYQNLKGSA